MSGTGNAPTTYEVLAVRYGTRTSRKSEVYLNFHVYGEPDGPKDMDYFCWVVRNPERTLVVDCGFHPKVGARRGRQTLSPPPEALAQLGIDPAVTPQIVATHAHYDHIGNLAAFPAAEVVMSQREFDFWTGPYGRRAQFATSAEAEEIDQLQRARDEGRATLVAGRYDVAPGIQVIEVGGHTPGQLIVVVATAGGQTVLASDAVHYYEEYERDWPFAFVADLEDMYRAFDLLREITSAPGSALVAGHDPEVMRRFPLHSKDLGGLVVRVG